MYPEQKKERQPWTPNHMQNPNLFEVSYNNTAKQNP